MDARWERDVACSQKAADDAAQDAANKAAKKAELDALNKEIEEKQKKAKELEGQI